MELVVDSPLYNLGFAVQVDTRRFVELFRSRVIREERREEVTIVLEGQYKDAYETIIDAYEANLHVALVGPPGVGKTLLCRKVALDLGRPFYWVTFTELVRSSTLIGTFDPVAVFQKGFTIDAFCPGPFLLACLEGAIFLANEINRADEYTLNIMLDALEERRLYVAPLRTWVRVADGFFLICAMNPFEMRGTRRLPEAIRDRIHVWIRLDYPPPELEKRIVLANCPEYTIPPHVLDYIVNLVSRLRRHPKVTKPPSLRASIALARFVAQRARRQGRQPQIEDVIDAVPYILGGAIETQPGVSPMDVLREIVVHAARE